MNGFFLIVGKQGSGKTLLAVKYTHDDMGKRPVFSNTTLFGIEYQPITFDNKKKENVGKIDILAQIDENPDYFNNSVMLIDEIHLYLDSRDFLRKNIRALQTFFSQLRKRHILVLGTAQSFWNVDIRIRRQCMNVLELEHLNKSVFDVTINEITVDAYGYYPVKLKTFLLADYYKFYDHEEVIY
jgi:hypothetical protein